MTDQTKIEDWEKELNKFYGCMFECGDYEALVNFIRQLLSSQKSFLLKKLLTMIKDMKSKQYEASTILESVELNLEFNKFDD